MSGPAEPTDDERALLRRYETSLAPLERALWSPPQADDAPLDGDPVVGEDD